MKEIHAIYRLLYRTCPLWTFDRLFLRLHLTNTCHRLTQHLGRHQTPQHTHTPRLCNQFFSCECDPASRPASRVLLSVGRPYMCQRRQRCDGGAVKRGTGVRSVELDLTRVVVDVHDTKSGGDRSKEHGRRIEGESKEYMSNGVVCAWHTHHKDTRTPIYIFMDIPIYILSIFTKKERTTEGEERGLLRSIHPYTTPLQLPPSCTPT